MPVTPVFKTYSGDDVIATFGTVILIGKGPDTFISITKPNASFESSSGIDGEVTRARSNDNRYEVTITLQQSADANLELSALHEVDQQTPNGDGVAELLIKDLSGTSLHFAPFAWIQNMPDKAYARTPGTVEWVFECASMKNFIGGN